MIDKIKQIYSTLSGNDRILADFIITNPEEIVTMNINELAQRTGVSSSSVSRFSKLLFGMSFSQFKVAVAKSMSRLNGEEKEDYDVVLSDSLYQIERKLINNIKRLLEEVMENNSIQMISEVASLIAKSENIYIFGIGASGLATQDFAQKLIKLGKRALFNFDANLAILNSSLCTERDLVIAISYSGLTKEVLLPVRKAKQHRCPVVAITGGKRNRLTAESDYVLSIPLAESKIIRMTAIYSRYGQFVLIDALYLAVMKELGKTPDEIMANYKDLLLELK